MMTGKDPVRILQVAGKGMHRGGTETWLMHILRHIDREQFRMDIMVETAQRQAYDEEIRALGSRIIRSSHHRRPLTYAWTFRRILRDQGPYDIVHSHLHRYNGYVLYLARQAGVPVRIAHSHTDFSYDEEQRGALWRLYAQAMRRLITKNATVGLAASHEAAGSLFGSTWESDPRWQILYCGIDLKPFEFSVEPVTVRAELGIPADAFVIGHVGRFNEQKNHAFLVNIAAEVARREPKMRLLLVGDGPLRPAIEHRIARAGIADKTIFTGVRSDVPRLMLGAMDVFVLPSLFEGLPIVGIETQAAGLPLICSDVVSPEMDVIQPLIQRVSLSRSVSDWAEAILAAPPMALSITQRGALRSMRHSRLNIDASVGEIKHIYAG
jgi:glycosyltransferase involved in cell wall biosynthesis